MEIWASGRLPEVKNNRTIEITSVESGRGRLREVKNNRTIEITSVESGRGRLREVLTGRNLVLWKSGVICKQRKVLIQSPFLWKLLAVKFKLPRAPAIKIATCSFLSGRTRHDCSRR